MLAEFFETPDFKSEVLPNIRTGKFFLTPEEAKEYSQKQDGRWRVYPAKSPLDGLWYWMAVKLIR